MAVSEVMIESNPATCDYRKTNRPHEVYASLQEDHVSHACHSYVLINRWGHLEKKWILRRGE